MKIHEAAKEVLLTTKEPMHAKDIHDKIVQHGLFTFGAKDPVAIVAQTLRKKSDVPSNKGKVIFKRFGQNRYGLAE